jgi:hypothetical protein
MHDRVDSPWRPVRSRLHWRLAAPSQKVGAPALTGELPNAILAGAVGTAVAITWFSGGLLPYVATVAWALGGVVVSTLQEGYPALTTAAGLGLLIVLVMAVLARRHDRSRGWRSTAAG